MATDKNFWTAAPTRDPKRGFRFRIKIPGIDSNYIWYAKKADKPQVSFSEASHSYLNHTYYWPGRAEWNEVSVTMVDPVEPSLAGNMAALVTAAGYVIPKNTNEMSTMSKAGSSEPLGVVIIEQIDEGGEILEQWRLNNAWVKELTFGELDYSSDDLTELTIKFRYDWATLGGTVADGPLAVPSPFFAGPTS